MKLATKTALAYSGITAAILFVFAYVVYSVSERNRKDEFFDRLDYKVTWRAEFIFDANISDAMIRKLHRQNQNLLNEADISVYDDHGKLHFTDLQPPLGNPDIINSLRKHGRKRWILGDYQYLGITYEFQGKDYYIIGRAKDLTGIKHIETFKKNVVIIYLISLAFVFVIGFIFSHFMTKPLKNIIHQIKDISEHNLNKRILVPKSKDELHELSETFNTTFNRLEKSFNHHKNFVTTISHEFRTPLSIMITELELAKELNVTIEDYRQSIDNALEDASKASQLSSALLDFARASYDISQIAMAKVRVDEILMESKLNLLQKNNLHHNIDISYDSNQESGQDYTILGNPYLLQVAFYNLMENACKYSDDHRCNVEIIIINHLIEIRFSDNGYGIPEKDQDHIFELFYRGKNKNLNGGNGVGLSIVKQIISIHHGEIYLKSEVGKGSTFSIWLNSITF